MEDSLVPLVNDPLMTSQAGRCAEGAAANTTGELLTVGKHTGKHREIRQKGLCIKSGALPKGNQEFLGTESSERAD